ncbi:MAG: amidase, partial [Gammaproteobacteria bacterium]|nr:amidase [Gammaproteobacteria bacterium]NIV20607.1 amidase [Gammaproteobacteria bacterium]NIY32258.1 amidase [Gammaproteobacteria bacterium]
EARERLRWDWHEFFQNYDIVLAPITPTPAFAHDHRSYGKRTLMVDDRETRYADQVFWAGLASLCYLPATAIPTGLNAQGLPIGVQIIGPEYADLITLGVARELEA